MKRLLILMCIFLSSISQAETKTKVLYEDYDRNIIYYPSANGFISVKIFEGAVPNTTILVQVFSLDNSPRECFTLIKGRITNEKDVENLKPESILQMSCLTPKVGTFNWFGSNQ
ncbi:MAG TPA: hypothetical protein PKC11_13540 [Agitococcus sp.]|nr:hypothetical protein [Agitococcus sp.]HNA22596.1 hypothetical protein [Agitococcus sp.]HNN29768.1 hypothetical protein [Agitococcus sp.]